MAIDFPSSPTTGQVFIVGSVTYIWDGTKWTSSATNSPFSLGSASTPSITFIGDTNTGLYSPGADQVSIATSSSEQIRIGSNGEIGINECTITGFLADLQTSTFICSSATKFSRNSCMAS